MFQKYHYFHSLISETSNLEILHTADQDQEFWTDVIKWHFQEMKLMIKSCHLHEQLFWEQRKWTILVQKWHTWEWWTEAPLYYNLLVTDMKNLLSKWLLFPYLMLGFFLPVQLVLNLKLKIIITTYKIVSYTGNIASQEENVTSASD